MAFESSTEVSLVRRRKIRKENPEEDPIHDQSPCRKRRIKHPDEPEPEPEPETEPAEPSYEFFNKIHDSMFFEILYRLPCRTAHQSKSVSKSWYSIISSPLFARGFIHHHRHQDSYSDSEPFNLLLADEYYFKEKIQVLPSNNSELCRGGLGFLNFLPRFKQVNSYYKFGIMASFNDLLLVYRQKISRKLRPPLKSFRKYYICNPLTKQWLKLPLLRENRIVKAGFICDAHNCDKNAHYRYMVVVLIRSPNTTTQLHMEIFSSEIGKWCKSVVSSPRELNPVINSYKGDFEVVACNGKLHWMDTGVNGMIKGFVVFDPFNDAKRCHYIELPKNLPPDLSFGAFRCRPRRVCSPTTDFSFGAFRGCLRIFLNPGAPFNHTSFYVWELKDYNNAGTWCMKHEVCFKNMVYEDSISRLVRLAEKFGGSMWEFLAFHPNNGEIVFFKFSRHNHCDYLVVCNMRTRELKLVGKLKSSDWEWEQSSSVFLLSQPLWPTPVPPLSLQFECSINC